MPSIHKSPTGWRVSWRELGKQHTKRLPTKREAMEFQRRLDERLLKPRGPAVTLRDAAKLYLANRRGWAEDPAWAAKDARTMENAIAAVGTDQVRNITPDKILRLPIGQFRLMKAALRAAARSGAQVHPGIVTCPIPQRQAKPRASLVTSGQAADARQAATQWGVGEGLAVHLISVYGHRPQTVGNLRVNDFEQESGFLNLTLKDGHRHRHPLAHQSMEIMAQAIKGAAADDYLIRPSNGLIWGRGQPMVDWYYRTIGKTVHPHDPGIYALKRWAITHMLDLGLTPEIIASITGHRVVSILLNTYARTNEERQAVAIAALSADL